MLDVSKIPKVYENQIEQKAFENAVQCLYYGFKKSDWNSLCLGKCKQNEIWKKAKDFWKSTEHGHFCHQCKYFVNKMNLCTQSELPVRVVALDAACSYFEEDKN